MYTIIHPSGEDDTPAFMRALAHEGSVAELISGCNYTWGHFVPPHGSTVFGHGGTNYTSPAEYNGPRVRRLAGGEAMVDCSNAARSVVMRGFCLDGVDGTAYGISGGSCHLTLERMYITDCKSGIGGAVHGSSAYTYVLNAAGCKIVNCRQSGVDSPVDSELANCTLAANRCNVYALPGANHNRIDAGRYEWPTGGENFRLVGDEKSPVRDWVFAGALQLDRAATCSIFLRHCSRIQLAMKSSGRPGRLGTTEPGTSAHLYSEDSEHILIDAVQMWAGADDDGT